MGICQSEVAICQNREEKEQIDKSRQIDRELLEV